MGKADRLIEIITTLASHPATSAGELADKLNISERSVYRYLSDLRRLGYFLRSSRDQESGLSKHSLTPLTFTAEEALTVASACQAFLSQEGLPFEESLERALIKIKSAISPHDERRTFFRLEPRFTHLTNKLRDYSPWLQQINLLQECIRHSRTAIVIYSSHSSGKRTERKMDPYDFFWSEGDLYIAAYCHKNGSIRNFKINRFHKVKKTADKFQRDYDFSLSNYLGSSWRVWRGDEVVSIKLLVYPPASDLFRESKFHSSQSIRELPGNTIKCSLETYDSPETRSWLLSWGKSVQVLEPLELREAMLNELKESLIVYGDTV